jgi:flagellar protein FliL
MATPTVLVNPSASTPSAPAPTPSTVKLSIAAMALAVAAGVVIIGLGMGGVVYYLLRTGRVPLERGVTQKAQADVAIATRSIALDPMLVNLADGSGSSYLRVSMTLRVADSADKKSAPTKEDKDRSDKALDNGVAAVRDTVLSVLGRQTADGLLAADGKEHLKSELKRALAEHNSDLKVLDVFVTDFLVQR